MAKRRRFSIEISQDIDVDLLDIFEQLEPEDVLDYIDDEELLNAMDEETIIKHLQQYGYIVKKEDEANGYAEVGSEDIAKCATDIIGCLLQTIEAGRGMEDLSDEQKKEIVDGIEYLDKNTWRRDE